MLKIETDRLSVGLYIMAVSSVLETRIRTCARKGQKSQNYLNHDIIIKDNQVAEN